jgi:hypothetical protein
VSRPFVTGERILLIDNKERRYLLTLAAGAEFHSHTGLIPHEEIIGSEEGVTLRTSRGSRYTAFRPTLSDFILKMPRGAQVIYPKDLGPILLLADIYPGARVLESATSSVRTSRRARRTTCAAFSVTSPRRGTASSCATRTTASTRRASTASCSTCPSRGRS